VPSTAYEIRVIAYLQRLAWANAGLQTASPMLTKVSLMVINCLESMAVPHLALVARAYDGKTNIISHRNMEKFRDAWILR
jgi:hypothetical protein